MKLKYTWLKQIVFVICTVAILSCSFTACNQQKAENNANILEQNIPVVNIAGIPLAGDLYYIDPVVTKNRDLLVLGNANHTLKQINKEYFGMNKGIVIQKFSDSYQELLRPQSINTPSWYTNNSYLDIDSMTFNPETFDIYFLGSKTLNSTAHYEKSSLEDIESWDKKIQEIGIVAGSTITKSIPIDSDNRFTKIRFFQKSETNPAMLLVSSTEGILYYTSLSSELISFSPLIPSKTTFVTWDVAEDTLVALDNVNQLHLFTLSTNENSVHADELNPPIPYPLTEEMTDPHLQYNPVNNCVVLWDAVSEGKCLYAVEDTMEWKWKQIAVSPTTMFPYNIVSFLNNASDDLLTSNLYVPSILFSCIGTDPSRIGNFYYPVYTNPYAEN